MVSVKYIYFFDRLVSVKYMNGNKLHITSKMRNIHIKSSKLPFLALNLKTVLIRLPSL